MQSARGVSSEGLEQVRGSLRMIGRVRQQRAIELRDLALAVLRGRGQWEVTDSPQIPVLSYAGNGLLMMHTTPFQRLPQDVPERVKYLVALHGWPARTNLPYGLDVWADGKKLNIQFDDGGQVRVVSYKPGPWESDLERLALETATQQPG